MYSTERGKKDALRRQLNFYRTLKIKGIPHTRFYATSGGQELGLQTLKENLLWVINRWATVIASSSQSASAATERKVVTFRYKLSVTQNQSPEAKAGQPGRR